MLFIEYPKCTTCQKARKWLEAKEIPFESRHIKDAPPSAEELRDWPGMTEEEQIAVLASDGMLVKRPVLVGENFVLTGFREAEWAAALDKAEK